MRVETKASDKFGGVETRLLGRLDQMEKRLSDQISELHKSLRAWIVIGTFVVAILVSLLAVFG